ncbi:hypothetical protein ACGFYU_12940 [Streptomyces sp. NPDC048337]|uniref:hypothetical protein n=1 Tax=Streptomyces sp. NPDC048337 TaxID=3365535 RepID=UPI003711D233
MPAKPLAKPPTKPPTTSRRVLAVAAATLAVAAATPATLADARPSATVSPTAVAPGGRVGLNIVGCRTRVARASSSAFGDVRLTPNNPQATSLFGSATVFGNASPGTHRVTFECDGPGGESVTVSLQVTPGAARGGTGGSIDSMSPGQIAAGGALVAVALAGGVWVMRRRATT